MTDTAERNRKIADAKYKIGESEFFLKELNARDRSTKLESSREFHYCLSAFLSASRSALQILCGDKQWGWVDDEIGSWDDAQATLYRTLRHFRNSTIHQSVAAAKASEVIEMVPEQSLPRRRPGRHDGAGYIPRLPCHPEPTVGIKTHDLKVGAVVEPAVECCSEYLKLIRKLVELRSRMPW